MATRRSSVAPIEEHGEAEAVDVAQTSAVDSGTEKKKPTIIAMPVGESSGEPPKYAGSDAGSTSKSQRPQPMDYDDETGETLGHAGVIENAEDLVTTIIHVDDDSSLNPWTFRFWFIGIGLAVFGSVLQEIYYFKPQTVYVSIIFLAVIAYVFGVLMETFIPRKGWIGRWFNPHPFNSKEHAAIVIMANAACECALGTEVLAVQRLWYGTQPNFGTSFFVLLSSQLLGYGIAGLLRETLVYPTKMLYPINLPLNTLLETLHRDRKETATRLKVFWIAFATLFVWEVFPEYIMPVLTGVSVFCLAKRDSLVFTNLFGGTNGNEGLGLLSICFDWQYVAGTVSPLWFPLQSLVNNGIGCVLCIICFMGVYYGNVWDAKKFPFLSQELYNGTASSASEYVTYNQTAILTADNILNETALKEQGLPYLAPTYAVYLLSTNIAITATLVHLLLWNYDDLKNAWSFASINNMKRILNPSTWKYRFWKREGSVEERQASYSDDMDPHYKLMLKYPDAPDWWYGCILVASFVVGMVVLYTVKSTLPWWSFIISCLFSALFILFFTAQYAITGFQFSTQPIVQMIGGYLNPGRPLANMYFVLFSYNSVTQGQLLSRDLKLAQYAHLPPRCTFVAQVVGTVIGALLNYVMMVSIIDNQREILLSIEGTNIWSGQNVQQYNSQAIAWGGLAKELFSVGKRYQWVTLAYLLGFLAPLPTYFLHRVFPKAGFWYFNSAISAYFIGWLCVGINSSITSYFIVGFISQWYVRKYQPEWFSKYNYILSAAMDGGTNVIVFILTFAVFGGAGKDVAFPTYWGNNANGNYDYCMYNVANG